MMTDPKGGIANIKKKIPVPNYDPNYDPNHESNLEDWYPPFQSQKVKKLVKVSDFNSKPGKLPL